jgi:hypothetical protein
MEFNYNAELMKFKAWQEEQERILSEAGMSKKDIKMIKDKDWEVFKFHCPGAKNFFAAFVYVFTQ